MGVRQGGVGLTPIVDSASFVLPRGVRLARWAAIAAPVTGPLWLLLLATVFPRARDLLPALVLFVPLWLLGVRSALRETARVEVTEAGIEARSLGGGRSRLLWGEAAEVRHLLHGRRWRRRRGAQRVVEVLSADGARRVRFDDHLADFDDLLALIRARAPAARETWPVPAEA